MSQETTWIEQALAASSADDCVVILRDTTEANLRWALNALTTNGQTHSRTASVVGVARRNQVGHAAVVSGPVSDGSDLVALVRQASAAATEAPASEDSAPLPEPVVDPDYELGAEPTGIGVFADLAAGLGRGLTAYREAGNELFGFAQHRATTTWLATSAGARRRHLERSGTIEVTAKHPDRIGSAWVGQATTDFTDVDADALVAEVTRRLGWCENRIELPAGRYETILPPSAVADLMILAYLSMSGRDAQQGRSVYAGQKPGTTRVGERLAGLDLSLWSGPGSMPAAPFAVVPSSEAGMTSVYDNGADVSRQDWLTDGVLTQLIYPRAGAERAGLDGLRFPTANLTLDAGSPTSLEEMIASTRHGLLLTCLWYIRPVDTETLLATGLTRDGVYLVEDGSVVGMVNNFRFNESPVDLLRRATQASSSQPTLCREWNGYFTWTSMPALRIPDFNMSTVSKAY
ncbi:MAG: metallopeptidase TldD-related protein [Actinomycetia bacterium]|nr:metallopeptidase TldD-related protein [Actinomycetes bacterium]